jgi:hypothetical protein
MKCNRSRTLLYSLCIVMNQGIVCAQTNHTAFELFVGTEYSPREHASERPHFGFGYEKEIFQSNSFLGIAMSGKRDVLRQESDTFALRRGFYVLEGTTGISISDTRSKLFAGPAVIVGGGVCWDNWMLDGSFPVFFSTALQLNINFPNDIDTGNEKLGVGIFVRCVYENFYYKIDGETNSKKRSRVNPMIGYEVGLRVALKGAQD